MTHNEQVEMEITQSLKESVMYYIESLNNRGYDGIAIFNDSIYHNYNDLLKDRINIEDLREAVSYLTGFQTSLLYSHKYKK
jgi:hypothetical protein